MTKIFKHNHITKLLKFFSLLLLIIAEGCGESVDPKSPFKEEYVVNFVLRGDTSLQVMTLQKSFDVPGFDPNTYDGNPFITDAQVELIYDGIPHLLANSTMAAGPGEPFDAPYPFYFLSGFNIQKGKHAELLVTLSDGRVLKSSTDTPYYIYISFLNTDSSIPQEEGGGFFANWRGSPWDTDFDEMIFHPELQFTYAKIDEGLSIKHEVQIPLAVEQTAHGSVATYPGVTNSHWITWQREMIDYAFESISAGDTLKSNYVIISAKLKLRILDENLGTYLASMQTFLDSYSVRVEEPDLSNIEGGFGVFGSYLIEEQSVSIYSYYTESFGYQDTNSVKSWHPQ